MSALFLAVMTVILCWQVVARYVLGNSPAWAEQIALVLIIWSVFLGSSAGVGLGFHVRISEGVERMSPRIARFADLGSQLLIVVFGLLLLFWGIQLVFATWQNAVPTLPFSRGAAYMVIPLSGLLIALFGVSHLLQGRKPGGESGI
jgi:TRAP-type C4-dicarboxylate transport system permease small subunit